MTTTTRISFKRSSAGRYTAKGATKVYDLNHEADFDGTWTLSVHEALPVSDLVLHGAMLEQGFYDTKRDAQAVAQAYHELGDDYRDADHGGKSRYTTAVLRAFGKDDA